MKWRAEQDLKKKLKAEEDARKRPMFKVTHIRVKDDTIWKKEPIAEKKKAENQKKKENPIPKVYEWHENCFLVFSCLLFGSYSGQTIPFSYFPIEKPGRGIIEISYSKKNAILSWTEQMFFGAPASVLAVILILELSSSQPPVF